MSGEKFRFSFVTSGGRSLLSLFFRGNKNGEGLECEESATIDAAKCRLQEEKERKKGEGGSFFVYFRPLNSVLA